MNGEDNKPMRFLRMDEVIKKVGYSRSYIYKLIQLGRFPQYIKLGQHASAFIESEIEHWMTERINSSRKTE